MINGCEIEELDVKLNNRYLWTSATVTAADQQSGKGQVKMFKKWTRFYLILFLALICFPLEEHKNCEEFDGSVFSVKRETKYSHEASCLALYHYQPVAVGSYLSDGSKKVEKFDGASWTELPDFSK